MRFHDTDQTMGCDHVSVHTQLNLPRSTQDLPFRNAQARMTTVIFACGKCGLAHEVTQVQVPTRKSGRFDCVDCGATIHSWYGVFDYSGCKAVRMVRGSGKAAFLNPVTFAGLSDPRRSGLSKPGRRH